VSTPGKLSDYLESNRLTLANTKRLVIDEADYMLDMGFDADIEVCVCLNLILKINT
jgi:superfamily II DNA/RNA helicase